MLSARSQAADVLRGIHLAARTFVGEFTVKLIEYLFGK